mgnify:FL=1
MIVADGCSTGKHSDVAARVMVHTCKRSLSYFLDRGSFPAYSVLGDHMLSSAITASQTMGLDALFYESNLVRSTREAVKACGYSPRANNLLVRVVDFNDIVQEAHGFKELRQIDADNEYDVRCGGGTALYDAVIDAVQATGAYAKVLFDNDFEVNAIIFVETDGEENSSNIRDVLN